MLALMRETIQREGMLQNGDRVMVAVSGGPDSVALLHTLHRLSPELGISLHVFHLDHGLRGEASRQDALYVSSLAEGLGVPCTVVTIPSGTLKSLRGSLQANAREVRYQNLLESAAEHGSQKVAVGHNRDDQSETVLMRFLRGTGPHGLAGIPPVRMEGGITLIRPLLGIARAEIEQYCRENELFPRTDESNFKPNYVRNRIRLELLPLLAQDYNPAILRSLAQLADVQREEDRLVDSLAVRALERCRLPETGVVIDGRRLHGEPLALARRVVRLAAQEAVGKPVDLGLDHVTEVLEASSWLHGTHELHLPFGIRVTVEYWRCRFACTGGSNPGSTERMWPIAPAGDTTIEELGLQILVRHGVPSIEIADAAFDLERLPGPLAIRLRRPGDRIWPVGMEGSKKLQDILVDAKVPLRMRDTLPVLVAGDEILWVIGYRLDRRYLAPSTTERAALLVTVRNLGTPPAAES